MKLKPENMGIFFYMRSSNYHRSHQAREHLSCFLLHLQTPAAVSVTFSRMLKPSRLTARSRLVAEVMCSHPPARLRCSAGIQVKPAV